MGGGGGHPDPEIREKLSLKKIFQPFGPQFNLQISGGGSPGSGTTTLGIKRHHDGYGSRNIAYDINSFNLYQNN